MSNTRDMTQGNPTRLILAFAIPMLLSNLFQQLYGMVDTIIVGRGVGIHALAAVGTTGYLHFFILGFVTGLTCGFGVLFAQQFGAGNRAGLCKAIAASLRVGMKLGLIITLLACFGARFLLKILQTPADIFDDAHLYIVVVFAVIPITLLFNLFSTILRSVGDARTPLMAMIASSLLNIALDLLFVFVFHWGVLGVALATDISQLLSCMICYIGIRKCSAFVIHREDFSPDVKLEAKLLKLGLPIAFMNSVTALGCLMLQGIVNSFGSIYVAGYTAASKLVSFMEQPINTLGMAMGVYTGQNLGAGKLDRVRRGVYATIRISLTLCLGIGLLMYFGRDALVMLFIRAEDAQAVLPISGLMMMILSIFMPTLGLLFIYRNTLQGMGDMITPMLSGFLELALRIGLALALTSSLQFLGVCIAEISAWTGAAVLLAVVYYIRCSQLGKKKRILEA